MSTSTDPDSLPSQTSQTSQRPRNRISRNSRPLQSSMDMKSRARKMLPPNLGSKTQPSPPSPPIRMERPNPNYAGSRDAQEPLRISSPFQGIGSVEPAWSNARPSSAIFLSNLEVYGPSSRLKSPNKSRPSLGITLSKPSFATNSVPTMKTAKKAVKTTLQTKRRQHLVSLQMRSQSSGRGPRLKLIKKLMLPIRLRL